MNQTQQTTGTPKEQLRAMRIIFIAIIAGGLLFAIVIFILNKLRMAEVPGIDKEYADVFLYITSLIAVTCLLVALNAYKKGITVAKDSLIPLNDKLNHYRATLIRYVALCDLPVIFSIIAFFVTGNYYLYIITGIMIAAILLKMPTRQRLSNELSLDWQQQQELE